MILLKDFLPIISAGDARKFINLDTSWTLPWKFFPAVSEINCTVLLRREEKFRLLSFTLAMTIFETSVTNKYEQLS